MAARPVAGVIGDVVALTALELAALALRWRYFGGLGLGDDSIFWREIHQILQIGMVLPDNQGYRFTWWLPTALVARVIGHTETAMVLPYLGYALANVALVYAMGRLLWNRWGAVVAALLLVVHPLDVAWSTLVTNDITLSFFSALAVFCTLRALRADDPATRRRSWRAAAIALVLCYYSKVSGLVMIPVVGAILLGHRARLADVRVLLGTALLLFALGALVAYALSGSPIGPVRVELAFQGLVPGIPRPAAGADILLYFPRLLFAPDHLGDLLNGLYPHALVLCALVGTAVGLRVEPALWWWMLLVVGAMEFNLQHVEGHWVSGFRNIRHAHVFVLPIIVLLTAYLVGLRRRWPRATTALVGLLVASAAWQAVSAGTKTHEAFADARTACRFLATEPPRVAYLDDVLRLRCPVFPEDALVGWTVEPLTSDPGQRTTILANATAGFVITGGSREPIYGGPGVVPLAAEIPVGRAELVYERDGPVDARWRPESLRIWRLRAPQE